jgi:hypothetical protein
MRTGTLCFKSGYLLSTIHFLAVESLAFVDNNPGLFIRVARKQIVITDSSGLKAATNGTYHQPESIR